MDIPDAAVNTAAEAIMTAQNANDEEPERFEARLLARASLEAAAPILAEAWNFPALQAEHEEWQRRGVTARRIQDEFWRDMEARRLPSPSPSGTVQEDEGP